MTPGRTTTLLTTRIPDAVFKAIVVLAEQKGITNSEYVCSILEDHVMEVTNNFHDTELLERMKEIV